MGFPEKRKEGDVERNDQVQAQRTNKKTSLSFREDMKVMRSGIVRSIDK